MLPICGCFNLLTIAKFARTLSNSSGTADNNGGKSFIATSTSDTVSFARKTSPNAPAPSVFFIYIYQ